MKICNRRTFLRLSLYSVCGTGISILLSDTLVHGAGGCTPISSDIVTCSSAGQTNATPCASANTCSSPATNIGPCATKNTCNGPGETNVGPQCDGPQPNVVNCQGSNQCSGGQANSCFVNTCGDNICSPQAASNECSLSNTCTQNRCYPNQFNGTQV